MTACMLCGLSNDSPIVVNRVARYGEPQVSHACARCGLVQVTDLPSEAELAAYYSGPYRERFGVPAPADPEVLAEYAARIRAYVGDGALLAEIGAGTGELSRAMKAHVSFEPDESVRPVEGVRLMLGSWEQWEWTADAVVACHVLEHMRDPIAALARLREHIDDDGRVWIEVPNAANPHGAPESMGLPIDASGLAWYFQRPHLYAFTPHTLAMCLARAGFDDIEVEARGLVLYGRAMNPRGLKTRTYDEALEICGPAEPGDVVADRLVRWERAHRRSLQLGRFLDGSPLSELGDDAEIVIRHEMRRAVEGASHAIEQLSSLHVALDAAVSGEDAPAADGAWRRGFDAGRAYGTQRAQLAVGLLASELVGVTQ